MVIPLGEDPSPFPDQDQIISLNVIEAFLALVF